MLTSWLRCLARSRWHLTRKTPIYDPKLVFLACVPQVVHMANGPMTNCVCCSVQVVNLDCNGSLLVHADAVLGSLEEPSTSQQPPLRPLHGIEVLPLNGHRMTDRWATMLSSAMLNARHEQHLSVDSASVERLPCSDLTRLPVPCSVNSLNGAGPTLTSASDPDYLDSTGKRWHLQQTVVETFSPPRCTANGVMLNIRPGYWTQEAHCMMVPSTTAIVVPGSSWSGGGLFSSSQASSASETSDPSSRRLVYSNRCGRVRLDGVAVRNAGIDWQHPGNVYWRQQVCPSADACPMLRA